MLVLWKKMYVFTLFAKTFFCVNRFSLSLPLQNAKHHVDSLLQYP